MVSFHPIPVPLVLVAGGISLCALGFPILSPSATATSRAGVPAHRFDRVAVGGPLVPAEPAPLTRDVAMARTASLMKELFGDLDPKWTFTGEMLPRTRMAPAAWMVSVDCDGDPVAEATWDSRNGYLSELSVLMEATVRRRESTDPRMWRLRLAPQGSGAPWRSVNAPEFEGAWSRPGERIVLRLARESGMPVFWRRSAD